MSAHLSVIDDYLKTLVLALLLGDDDDTVVALMARIRNNYAAALKDLEWQHQERLKWRAAYYALGGKADERDALIEGADLR